MASIVSCADGSLFFDRVHYILQHWTGGTLEHARRCPCTFGFVLHSFCNPIPVAELFCWYHVWVTGDVVQQPSLTSMLELPGLCWEGHSN